MKHKSSPILKAAVFCSLFLLLFIGSNRIFQPVWYEWNNYYTFQGFYEEPKDSIETIFLGSSTAVSGISPMELYAEYGICSYNLASEQQPVFSSYYWLLEAQRLHSETLKNVVLEVSMLRRVPEDAFYLKALDPMAFSRVKWKALRDYTNDNVKEIFARLVPFFAYHDRWDMLSSEDFAKRSVDCNNGTRGFHPLQGHYASQSTKKVGLVGIPPREVPPADFNEEALLYLDKMVGFCRENGLSLILIKTPADDWSDSFHQAAMDLSPKYDLTFLDYSYAPCHDDLGYCYPFDNYDDYHVNIGGAQKITSSLGRHLTKQYRFIDVRSSSLATHMDEQLSLYQNRIGTALALDAAKDIPAYLSVAMSGDNTILLSIRDEGTRALTEKQRQALADRGLKTLSSLTYRASYLAIIGKDGITELEKSASQEDGKALSLTAKLFDRVCTVKSGGLEHGDASSIVIDGIEYSKNQRGINVVVYSNSLQEVIHTAAFDTHSESTRDVYSPDMGPRAIASVPLCLCTDPLDYLETAMAGNNIVLIAVRDEAVTSFSDEQRQHSETLGLPQLAALGYRESYLAVLDGDFRAELRGEHADYTYTYENTQFSLKSRGYTEGDTASLCINGTEYAKNSRGLNILVYNKDLNAVIDSAVFDTYTSPVRKAFTLESLNIYELKDISIYEQAQLYEAARYMEKPQLGGGAA